MKIYILVDDDETMAFSSEKKLLEYYQSLYPHAKHLRLLPTYLNHFQVLNYNTPVTSWCDNITRIKLDEVLSG